MNSSDLKQRIMQKGAVVCGIASIDRFENAPKGFHPSDIFPETQSVMVFGLRFPVGTAQAKTTTPYTLVRNMLIHQADTISTQMTWELEQEGIAAVPIPAASPYDYWDADNRHGRGILSLKHAAVLAGLGIMGKNTLLLNEHYGNMLWLGAILLSVPLAPDPLCELELCPDGCRICLINCPQQALDGITISQKRCREIMGKTTEGGEYVITCNHCRIVCPYYQGKRNRFN